MKGWGQAGWLGVVAVWFLAGLGGGAEAAPWSRAYINALPDEAFAIVEERPDGSRARHLPHHDAQGRVDPAHLRNALSRWNQVRWADPANAERARQHLLEHLKAFGPSATERRRGGHRTGPRPQLHVPGASLVAGAAHPRAPRQAAASPTSTAQQPATALRR
jgi:hypothetical protein